MVRSDTRSLTISDLFLKVTDHSVYGASESIEITSDFQRGDEEHGVWSNNNKQRYITSLRNRYPTGILIFVKDHENASLPWKVLDGGNRLRTKRDFMNNKFNIIKDYQSCKFSDFTEQEIANFNTTLIPCQFITIERNDDDCTISEMFCCLNTSASQLSHGELFKAHGWKSNVWEIEMAKKIVGDKWETNVENDRLITIRAFWVEVFGELGENKRCKNLAMMLGYIISAKKNNFELFDTKYELNSKHLTPTNQMVDEEAMNNICTKINTFLDIVREIGYRKELFGTLSLGIPPKSKIAPIWKCICEDTLTPEFRETMIRFYRDYMINDEVINEYKRILTKNGDNHTNSNKIDAIYTYMKTFG